MGSWLDNIGGGLRSTFGGCLFEPRPDLRARAVDHNRSVDRSKLAAWLIGLVGRRRPASRSLRVAARLIRFTFPAMRLTPQRQSDRDWIDMSLAPPGRLITAPMQFLMMEPADRNGELVADLASQSALLGKAQMMGIGGKAAAN